MFPPSDVTSLRAVSPVSRFPSPGSEQARTMTVSSGRQCATLLRDAGPLGLSVKMCLESSVWNSTVCLLNWRASAISPRFLLFRLVPSMPATEETEYGLWPTPNVPNGGRAMKEEDAIAKGKTSKGKRQVGLANAVKFWPTASARDWKSGKSNQHGKNSRPLNEVVALFPTPQTQGLKHCVDGETRPFYPTPDAGMAKGRGQSSAEDRSRLGGSLNPQFVEWLMGFPKDWTALPDGPKKTPKSRASQPESPIEQIG